jgi:hypothetical protein
MVGFALDEHVEATPQVFSLCCLSSRSIPRYHSGSCEVSRASWIRYRDFDAGWRLPWCMSLSVSDSGRRKGCSCLLFGCRSFPDRGQSSISKSRQVRLAYRSSRDISTVKKFPHSREICDILCESTKRKYSRGSQQGSVSCLAPPLGPSCRLRTYSSASCSPPKNVSIKQYALHCSSFVPATRNETWASW